MQDIVDFFPNLSSLVVYENNVTEIDFANFIDSKLHRLYDSLMRRGVSVATTRGSPITDNRYFYLATDSPRVVKDLVEKTIDLVDYHGGRMVNIFLTLNPELRHHSWLTRWSLVRRTFGSLSTCASVISYPTATQRPFCQCLGEQPP